MHKYVIKRLLSLIPVLFIVSIVIFMLIHLVPGDPAAMMLGEQATPAHHHRRHDNAHGHRHGYRQ